MNSFQHKRASNSYMEFLKRWDLATATQRKKILKGFLKQTNGRTGLDFDSLLGLAPSLFFTRVVSWLRLSYMSNICLHEQLKVVLLFLSLGNGVEFISEFMEVGGILTLLEIMCMQDADQTSLLLSVQCLHKIADCTRKHKELICEAHGIRIIAETLARASDEKVQASCMDLLQKLSFGNPDYLNQVYRGLIALLLVSSPKVQQLTAAALREVQLHIDKAHASIVQPLLKLLRTMHYGVQFHVIELIKLLVDQFPNVKQELCEGLVKLIAVEQLVEEYRNEQAVMLPASLQDEIPYPLLVQQAAACKTICVLCKNSNEAAQLFLEYNVVVNCLLALANLDHIDTQKQAALVIQHYCETQPEVQSMVQEIMGDELYSKFISDPKTFYQRVSSIDVEILRGSQLAAKHLQFNGSPPTVFVTENLED